MPETLDIYIVEDDEDTRESLTDILELDKHRVFAFGSAAAALAHPDVRDVDVVLLDRKLPDGFAEQLLPRFRARASDAEFIIITAYADMHAAIAALREGVADYLIKPVDPDAIRATLTRLAKRRAVERELYRQRRFAEKLLETAEAIILVLDPRGRIIRANPHLLELTGYTLDEVIDEDWFEKFIPPRHQQRIRSLFNETVAQPRTRGLINPILTKDGQECEVRWSNSTLRNASGETTAVLSIGLDVTEYVRTQRQLVQQERLAAIGQTMTGLAHESRNALQRLQNAVELLQDELEGQPEALRDLAKVERASNQIRDLLEEVRAYAAPINLHRTLVSLPRLWRRAWYSLDHLTVGRDVTLHENLPDSNVEVEDVSADARRMEQVFRNLFENSLDATRGTLLIKVTLEQSADSTKIIVRDSGPGVPESHRETLFDAFSTTKPTGTGLGLAICRRTVEAHGGQLRLVDSREGAVFAIELPSRK